MKGLGPQLSNWIPEELTLFISKELFLDLILLAHISFLTPKHARDITTSLILVCLEASILASPLEEVVLQGM